MTREQIVRWLNREERKARNAQRTQPDVFNKEYLRGRAHACSELLTAIQRTRRAKKKAAA